MLNQQFVNDTISFENHTINCNKMISWVKKKVATKTEPYFGCLRTHSSRVEQKKSFLCWMNELFFISTKLLNTILISPHAHRLMRQRVCGPHKSKIKNKITKVWRPYNWFIWVYIPGLTLCKSVTPLNDRKFVVAR